MIGINDIPRCYGNHSETSITPLSSCLVWRFLGTIGISCIPCCHGNLAGITKKVKPQ